MEAPEHNVPYTYGFPSIPRFQLCYLLVNRATRHGAMLMYTGSGKISHCIGGREGGIGTKRSLHLRIPLNPTTSAVLFACQSDHASQSYANPSRIRQNQPLLQEEGRRHRSTAFFTCTDSPRSHDSSRAIRLSIRPHVKELCQCFQIQAKSAIALVVGKEVPEHDILKM